MRVWGATREEAGRGYPADGLVGERVVRLTRAIDVAAPQELTWRWLCQIAVAPYSYDWIDNRGRRSPQQLTPGAERLVVGQTMAKLFRLTSFDAPHQWTALTSPGGRRLFGPVAMTFAAEPSGPSGPSGPSEEASRIVVRLAVPGGGLLRRARVEALAWGDVVMMRRQLLNLKALAERDAGRRRD